MLNGYPPESQKMNVIAHLEELRRRLLICLAFLVVASIIFFIQGAVVLKFICLPLTALGHKPVFIAPTEVFGAQMKAAALFGFLVTFPVVLYELGAFLSPALSSLKRSRVFFWMSFAFLCFVAGVAFSFYLALPAALKFLVSFGSEVAVPQITLGRYISFFVALILMGGLIFEIPVVIGLLADIGLIPARVLVAQRKLAYVAILIMSALVTPTQDIVNMLIFAVPMIGLYEIGVFIARQIEQGKKKQTP